MHVRDVSLKYPALWAVIRTRKASTKQAGEQGVRLATPITNPSSFQPIPPLSPLFSLGVGRTNCSFYCRLTPANFTMLSVSKSAQKSIDLPGLRPYRSTTASIDGKARPSPLECQRQPSPTTRSPINGLVCNQISAQAMPVPIDKPAVVALSQFAYMCCTLHYNTRSMIQYLTGPN